MNVRRHASASEYLDTAGAALRRRPVINQLTIAIAQTCANEPERYGAGCIFYSVEDGGEVVGAALQTPPWPVQVSAAPIEAARELGLAFAAEAGTLPGVGGPDDVPGAFAEAYATQRGLRYHRERSSGTFELTAVADLPAVPGRRVIAGPEHAEILQAWHVAFHDEATAHAPPVGSGSGARAVSSGRAHLWLDEAGVPVSYAFNNRDVEGWASLGPVYTPPGSRSRGYATALVASASQFLLDQGRPGCTLYTDLANPTSNAIYERIGYRRIGTAYQYGFSASVAR